MRSKKKECPSCAMSIDEAAETCPVCQYEFPAKQSPLTRWIVILFVVLFLLLFFFGF
jgi:RNA polymerase subunit RPABC4/transcription elongation factor Spt4